MEDRHSGPYWDAVRLALDQAPAEEFLGKAHEAKKWITDQWWELSRRSTILDNLVAEIAPDADWTPGIQQDRDAYGRPLGPTVPTGSQSATSGPQKPTQTNRASRIAEIAEQLSIGGTVTVRSAGVAERLLREGYEGDPRNMAVAVGNVLSRSGGWKRVGPGEYEQLTI